MCINPRIFLIAACLVALVHPRIHAEELKDEAARLVKVLIDDDVLEPLSDDAIYSRLKEIGPEAANSPFPPTHKDWWWATAALRGEAVRHLRPLLKSEDKQTREKGLEIIRLYLAADARPLRQEIVRLVQQDPEREVRVAAAEAISAIGLRDPATAKALVELCKRTDDVWEGTALLEAIGVAGEDTDDLKRFLVEIAEGKRKGEVRYSAMLALAKLDQSGSTAAPLFVRLFKDKDIFGEGYGTDSMNHVAGRELKNLGQRSVHGAPVVVQMLTRDDLKDADCVVLMDAFQVLQRSPVEAKKVETLLRTHLRGWVRPKGAQEQRIIKLQIAAAQAILAIHSGKDRECEEFLLSILSGDKWIRDGKSIPRLGTYYPDPRIDAARAASELGPGLTAALPHLRTLLEDAIKRHTDWIKDETAWAIALIDPRDEESLDHFQLSRHVGFDGSVDPKTAAKAMGSRSARLMPQILPLIFGEPESNDKVHASVRDFVIALEPDMMPQVIDEGIRRLKSKEHKDNPEFAASNLGAFGKRARGAVPRLLELLHDPDVEVRARAAVCLGLVHEESAQTVPALVAALDDSRILVRARAAESLARFGKNATPAVEALNKRAKDESEWVRTVAAEALQSIKQTK